MSIARVLRGLLKEHNVCYETIYHGSSYTAQQLAHSKHIPGQNVTKVVLLKDPNEFIMAVLPACYKVDFSAMKRILGCDELRLATEEEIRKLFPDCEIGAMPPFGEAYHLKVYADEALSKDEYITFSAGTHREAIQMKYEDWAACERPEVKKFALHL
ncbi:MAG: hypothetical protein A2Z91_07165 [Deltaproteobacteria bacterium GWA2_38_16]|nr:MAG: hypothetical protein A2Z91_07165 [Deltaproteobacteria bacterium GWA2_38_16]OGQ02243.1 MAG: hypothetical protein A3D19_00315 [Deltaproteobacteria bacterium RIFCSPHIGHO2_02_FULL_38_15]OGQ59034.1 MAG: hypothetical protein A3G92_05030 [Deltaproteobacteria bacterium RIFCSPLOWO2_12_FULL_38_8]